ncbi:hypothetical protein ACFL2R_02400 [Patescibacteria group bacterium]
MSEEVDDLFSDLDRALESSSEVDKADKIDLSMKVTKDDAFSFLDEEGESFDDDVHVGMSLCVQPDDWPEIMVSGSSVNLVAVLVDDSGSMSGQAERELKMGLSLMIKELRSVVREMNKDTFLVIRGFKERYYAGDVMDLNESQMMDLIRCNFNETPLYSASKKLASNISSSEESLKARGISVSVNVLIMTDGRPNREPAYSFSFDNSSEKMSYWKTSGLYIHTERGFGGFDFKEVFSRLGVKKMISANPSELRRALYQFSRSVSAV